MLVRLTDSANRPVAVETTNVVAVRYHKDEVTIVVTNAARGTSRTIMVLGSVDEVARILSRRSFLATRSGLNSSPGPHLIVYEGGRGIERVETRDTDEPRTPPQV
jgi:hypothetical protein